MATKLLVTRGENPDITVEFFADDKETVRLDLTGAGVTVSSNIPNLPAHIAVDLAQGIITQPLPEAVTLSMKAFTDYRLDIRAVDADGEIHLAKFVVVAK